MMPLSTEISVGDTTEQLSLELSREMRQRWHSGEQPMAEEFFSRHPQLWQHPESAVELIYEEFCLRQSAGEAGVEQEILRRFPQWSAPLRVMLDCHRRVLQSDCDQPQFPSNGERIGQFKLIAELARGSRGRIFLAKQTTLADRPVVLKITPLDGGEHLSLARLQHTNIVPLYSVLDDEDRRIRVLCMPYFGRATLASLLEFLKQIPAAHRTGRDIVMAIDGAQETSVQHVPVMGAAREMLGSVDYVQAMTWITSCLADALQFAHERGVVHLDLKPSNILLAADGQPMVLDFHLAREPVRPNGPPAESFGGTPPYMPPEQHAALQAMRSGQPADVTVDGRADIYALGAMLYESLGGELPIGRNSVSLVRLNSQVSAGLSDIVAKSVADRPENRYADARSLADDLRRHLTDQPLTGVGNRSISERWRKWRRRSPSTVFSIGMLVVVSGAIAILLAGLWFNTRDRRQQGELALQDGLRQLQGGRHVAEAVHTFQRGLAAVENSPLQLDIQRQLREQLAAAKRLELAQQLHQLADQIRMLYSADPIPPGRLRPLAAQCNAFWQKRAAIAALLGSMPGSDIPADLQDIALLAARGSGREGVHILDQAEEMFGPNAVLEQERRNLQMVTNPTEPLPEAGNVESAARTAWEHCALGRALLAASDLARAGDEFSAALKLDPAGQWPNFYSGLCAYKTGRYDDAIVAFSVCIGVAPRSAGHYYNRALAYAALGRSDAAMNDYDQALQLDPGHPEAALNRGVLHLKQGEYAQALSDLNLALEHGADPATAHYDLALVHIAMNAPALALQEAKTAVKSNPSHEPSRILIDNMER